MPPEGSKAETIQERIKEEEMAHTGTLKIKIIRAQELRYADVRRSQASDPYVMCYVRNDAIAQDTSDRPMNIVFTMVGASPSKVTPVLTKALAVAGGKTTVNSDATAEGARVTI